MYHPTTRLLTILELLQARPMMSGAELATRLEVDRRTVRKYIMMLQDLGIPIETTRGPTGGYHLRPGYKLPPLMLSNEKALAVMLSLLAARRQGIGVEPHLVEGALAKIERVLPESLRLRLQAVQATVAFVPESAKPMPTSATVLLVSMAVQDAQRLQLHYQSREGETERAVDPYGIVSHWEQWYLVGWCHLRQAIRVFRLDRILDVALDEATFAPPANFDPLNYVLESLATAPHGWLVEILLETTLAEAQQRMPPGSAVLEECAEGVLMRLYSTDLAVTARYLGWWDCSFVICRPPELRTATQELAATMAANAQRERVE
ncbi:MAG: transcriptional regulator [Caldilineaceae bacterium]|nr:transcriptional regulator [Caldilineaceae bacterium]